MLIFLRKHFCFAEDSYHLKIIVLLVTIDLIQLVTPATNHIPIFRLKF